MIESSTYYTNGMKNRLLQSLAWLLLALHIILVCVFGIILCILFPLTLIIWILTGFAPMKSCSIFLDNIEEGKYFYQKWL